MLCGISLKVALVDVVGMLETDQLSALVASRSDIAKICPTLGLFATGKSSVMIR